MLRLNPSDVVLRLLDSRLNLYDVAFRPNVLDNCHVIFMADELS